MSSEALAVLGVDGFGGVGKVWLESSGLRGRCWRRVESEMLGRSDGRRWPLETNNGGEERGRR